MKPTANTFGKATAIALAIAPALIAAAAFGAEKITEPVIIEPTGSLPYLSPEETLETLQVPDGYRLEVVLAEPHIAEPVAAAEAPVTVRPSAVPSFTRHSATPCGRHFDFGFVLSPPDVFCRPRVNSILGNG